MSKAFRTVFKDDSLHLACADRFVLMNWRSRFDAEHIAPVEKLHHERVKLYPQGVIGLNILEPGCAMPDSASREAANDMMTRTGPTTLAVVMVMLDQGFAASALQSLALRVLGLGGRVPIRNFREIDAALQWIKNNFPEAPQPSEATRMVKQLRAR